VAVGVLAAIAFTRPVGTDYGNLDCHVRLAYCDDAEPSLSALIHGDISGFFHRQTLMGPTSILLRAPVAALGGLNHYETKLVYDLGSFVCLLVLAAAGVLVASEMRRRGRPGWEQALVAAGMVVNPVTFRALYFGHPEEAVATAFCVAGAVFALRVRPVPTGMLLGLAITTKLWGVLAAGPLLLALPPRLRLRGAVVATLTVLALYGPMAVVTPTRFWHAVTSANELGTTPGTASATNVWWFFADTVRYQRVVAIQDGRPVFQDVTGFALPRGIGRVTHPLVIVLSVVLAWLWSRRPRAPGDASLLLLLALIFLLRCILDPNNFSYYHLPFLASLLAYEGISRRGIPWAAITAAVIIQLFVSISPHVHSDPGFAWLYLGWALPMAAVLAFWTFGRPSTLGPCPSSA